MTNDLRRSSQPGGSALACVLFAVFLVFALTAALTLSGNLHCWYAGEQAAHAHNVNLADSALAQSIERILSTGGVFGQATTDRVVCMRQTAIANISFAASPGTVYSVNNLSSDGTATGYRGMQVPPAAAELLADCSDGRDHVIRRVILHLPPFPYAIASSGKVHSANGMQVGSLPPATSVAGGLPATLLPCDLVSNSSDLQAVVLPAGSSVTGDVTTCGGVQIAAGVVQGQVRTGWQPVPLPSIDIASYDPSTRTGGLCETMATGAYGPISGLWRGLGHVDVNSDLVLDDAVVYVDGDLIVHGQVRGTGALLATGLIGLEHGTHLDTNNRVAVAAGTGVSLLGSAPADDFFQGLVYTEGPFKAQKMTLLGSFAANSSLPDGADMDLENVTVVHVPDYSSCQFMVDFTQTQPPTPPWFSPSDFVASSPDHIFAAPVLVDGAAPFNGAPYPATLQPPAALVQMAAQDLPYQQFVQADHGVLSDTPDPYWNITNYPDWTNMVYALKFNVTYPNDGTHHFVNGIAPPTPTPGQMTVTAQYADSVYRYLGSFPTDSAALRDVVAQQFQQSSIYDFSQHASRHPTASEAQQIAAIWFTAPSAATGAPLSWQMTYSFYLSLDQFLPLADRVQVMLWRDLQ